MIVLINVLLFPIIPFLSVIMLLFSGKLLLLFIGALIIWLTPLIYGLLIYPEQQLVKHLAKHFSIKTLSYIMPIHYFILVIASITLCWLTINYNYKGDLWVFLFTFACCYLPYSQMVQGEKALNSGIIDVLTNTVHNYCVFSSFVFLILMNFTNISIFLSYFVIILIGALLFNGLPERIYKNDHI